MPIHHGTGAVHAPSHCLEKVNHVARVRYLQASDGAPSQGDDCFTAAHVICLHRSMTRTIPERRRDCDGSGSFARAMAALT